MVFCCSYRACLFSMMSPDLKAAHLFLILLCTSIIKRVFLVWENSNSLEEDEVGNAPVNVVVDSVSVLMDIVFDFFRKMFAFGLQPALQFSKSAVSPPPQSPDSYWINFGLIYHSLTLEQPLKNL